MKKIISFWMIAALAFVISCNEKEISASDVPQPAMAAFNAKYPGASDVKWITEKEDNKTIYEAKFKFNGEEIEAEFNADGSFIKEE